MALRLAAPGLGALALVLWLTGAGGAASLVLLAAIVAGSARLLGAVGDAAEGRRDRFPVVTAVGGLVWLVAAGAAHAPLLVLGLFVCLGLELLAALVVELEPEAVAESAEPVEPPVSRAA